MAKVVKTNQLPVITDLTNANVIGLTSAGVDAQFPLAQIVRNNIGSFKTTDSAPTGQLLGQSVELVGDGTPGSKPSGTYTNLLKAASTPIVIPTPATGNGIFGAKATWKGTYWDPIWQELPLPVQDLSGYTPKPTFDTLASSFNIVTPNNKVGEQLTESGSAFSFEAPSFSGWATQAPAIQNFDNITFKLRQYDASFPITSLKVVIRENNSTGTILSSKSVTGLTFVTGTAQNINVMLDANVPNASNVPLWIGISCNGRCGRYGGVITGTTNKALYTSALNVNTEPATAGTESIFFGFWIQFYKQGTPVYNVKPTAIPTLPDNSVLYAKTAAGDKLKTNIDQADKTLKDVTLTTIVSEQLTQSGSVLDFNTSSPSTSWGSQIPAAQNFNGIKFGMGCGYVGNPVTSIKIIIRENNSSGTVLVTKTFTGLTITTDSVINVLTLMFDSVIPNTSNVPLWVEYLTNGRCGFFGNTITTSTNKRLYATATDLTTEPATLTSDTVVKGLWMQLLNVSVVGGFATATENYIKTLVPSSTTTYPFECFINLQSQLYVMQTQEINIYLKNLIYCNMPLSDVVIDVVCAKGRQYADFWRYTPDTTETGSFVLTVNVYYRNVLYTTASTTVNIAAVGNGNATRKINVMGDSTIASNQETIELNNLQNASGNLLKLTQIGILGAGATKHEGRGGYTFAAYSGAGTVNYTFNVAGVTTPPAIASAQYSNNGAVFLVQTVNITSGSGTIICTLVSGTAPASSGTLTKTNGSAGDASITFSSFSSAASNPYYKAATSLFDYSYYLTNNSFTMASGDWFIIQLGINDFRFATDDAGVNTMITSSLAQLDQMIASYQSAVSGGKVGYVMTFGPAGSQDGFAATFASGTQRDRVVRNFALWRAAVITHLDTSAKRTAGIYLIPANLNMDTDNNFPTTTINLSARNTGTQITVLNDAIHPATAGYQQISDSIWALIKFIG
jgi:lysophospholipase L1-like esterase